MTVELVTTEPSPVEESAIDKASRVLEFLSVKTGIKWRARHPNGDPTKNAQHIMLRLRQGYTVNDCKTIISAKWREWGSNPDMRKFVRPSTLFESTSNFERYLAELNL